MDQTRATNRLILLSLSADFNVSAQLTSAFFFHSLCGPILMIFGGPETQHGELSPHRRAFFVWQKKMSTQLTHSLTHALIHSLVQHETQVLDSSPPLAARG